MITVDREFEALIPPLSADEYTQLEKNICKEGIRDPLVVWKAPDGKEILLDGHNRWKISAAHAGIRFDVVYEDFKTRYEAEQWIIRNQLGRRNLHDLDKQKLLERDEEIEKNKAKERHGYRSDLHLDIKEKFPESGKQTRDVMGAKMGVSGKQYDKLKAINEKATERTKQLVREGSLSINQAYNGLFPKRPNPVEKAKKDHEEFQAKKQESVVNFKDAQADKLNQSIIAGGLHHEIMSALGKLDALLIEHTVRDVTEMSKKLKDEERDRLIKDCQWSQRTLMTIMNALIID